MLMEGPSWINKPTTPRGNPGQRRYSTPVIRSYTDCLKAKKNRKPWNPYISTLYITPACKTVTSSFTPKAKTSQPRISLPQQLKDSSYTSCSPAVRNLLTFPPKAPFGTSLSLSEMDLLLISSAHMSAKNCSWDENPPDLDHRDPAPPPRSRFLLSYVSSRIRSCRPGIERPQLLSWKRGGSYATAQH
ncbi:hypothetical protein BDR22DRAFT_818256 [Usnea florida]